MYTSWTLFLWLQHNTSKTRKRVEECWCSLGPSGKMRCERRSLWKPKVAKHSGSKAAFHGFLEGSACQIRR